MPTDNIDQSTSADTTNPVIAIALKVVFAIAVAILLVIIGKIIASIVRRKVLSYDDNNNTKQITQVAWLIHDVVYYSLIAFAWFVGFEILGFDAGLIIGWISLWVWLAFKWLLSNMIAGIMLLTNKDVKLWDIVWLNIDSSTSYFWRIEEINLRYTIIRTFDLKQVVLPNTTLMSASIETYSTEKYIKLSAEVDVHYDTDLEFATKVLREAINSCEYVLKKDKTIVYTTEFGDSWIVMKGYFFINPNSGLLIEQVVWLVNEQFLKYMDSNNVQMPYDHVTLNFDLKDQKIMNWISNLINNSNSVNRE